MKIRKLKLNKELLYPDDGGEIIRCPVCQDVWMKYDEHSDSFCPHLRFVYCTVDNDFVFFVGDWNHEAFKESFLELAHTEEGIDEMKAFRKITHPEVDAVVYLDEKDFPLVQWSTFWGYRTEKQSLQANKKGV